MIKDKGNIEEKSFVKDIDSSMMTSVAYVLFERISNERKRCDLVTKRLLKDGVLC